MTEEDNAQMQAEAHQQELEHWQQQMEADRKELLLAEIKQKVEELEKLIAA